MLIFFNCTNHPVRVAAANSRLQLREVSNHGKVTNQFAAEVSTSSSPVKLSVNRGIDDSFSAKYEVSRPEISEDAFETVNANERRCFSEVNSGCNAGQISTDGWFFWLVRVVDGEKRSEIQTKTNVVAYYADGGLSRSLDEDVQYGKALFLINRVTNEYVISSMSQRDETKPLAKVGHRDDKLVLLKVSASEVDGDDKQVKVGDKVLVKIDEENGLDFMTVAKESAVQRALKKLGDCVASSERRWRVSFSDRCMNGPGLARQTWKISKHCGHTNSPGDVIRIGDWVTFRNCATDGYLRRLEDKKVRRIYVDEVDDEMTAWLLSLVDGNRQLQCVEKAGASENDDAYSLATDDSDCYEDDDS